MGVKGLMSFKDLAMVTGKREECRDSKIFDSHNKILNSHTLKVGVFDISWVKFMVMRCI